MSVTQEQVLEYIAGLKLGEVKSLVEALEGRLGVSAAAPMAVVAASGAAAAVAEEVEEKTEFTVVLKTVGDKKINVIKEVRAVTGLGLKEAKELVESAPSEVKIGITKEEAEELKKKLQEAGAEVEIK